MCVHHFSFYSTERLATSLSNKAKLTLPIIPIGIIAYASMGQPTTFLESVIYHDISNK